MCCNKNSIEKPNICEVQVQEKNNLENTEGKNQCARRNLRRLSALLRPEWMTRDCGDSYLQLGDSKTPSTRQTYRWK